MDFRGLLWTIGKETVHLCNLAATRVLRIPGTLTCYPCEFNLFMNPSYCLQRGKSGWAFIGIIYKMYLPWQRQVVWASSLEMKLKIIISNCCSVCPILVTSYSCWNIRIITNFECLWSLHIGSSYSEIIWAICQPSSQTNLFTKWSLA